MILYFICFEPDFCSAFQRFWPLHSHRLSAIFFQGETAAAADPISMETQTFFLSSFFQLMFLFSYDLSICI